ncbi:valine--tRNA ligase [Actinoalloteichus sp. AHMU CJ021]|uniref:Valine--tRNA ligase n=1 Tax=Actinoalloteichus caeruleus DSM 43889 TaxID=1120930 RepID=A0ABT1JPX8_ACTCY|nr:valine--tRNA ligase [Actinoalloteichus caeruleus]AUS80007.1 valine--tRNA ligase [Actinoalloteichus sp. AHMU CJ021]MCP2334186.1 valyl-tRNA synthetase [Actinoalloteichus caeruleus DSM 43889]
MTETHSSPGPAQFPVGLAPKWEPVAVEAALYQEWVERGDFTADASSDRPPFSIVIPPPNVTGVLHMGHALDHTLMDTLTRRRRMQGYEALWLPGMDHAGIATQTVVERELASEGKSRHDLGREEFVRRVWQWKAQSGGQISQQMRRLGDGVDWSRERFTMDEGLSRAVQTIFKRLYDDDLIYRAERIINWCPRCQTALSDIEVEHSEDEGELVSIRYGEGDSSIVVATTRAETMLGDTAVAVHPEDERYRHLVGTEVELPLTGRRIPIVADEHVDPEFGTGAVKVTPSHDPNDFEIGQRHGLPNLTVLDERGVITAAGPFEGLDRFEARPAIVAALRAEGRIVAEKRPYLHAVGHCERCGTVVEPRLSKQWFVNVGPLAKAAGDAVRDGRTRIHPPEMAKRYFSWVDNLHDWCISRQLWWGHRIPVWYGPDGEMRCVGPGEEPPTGEGWHQETDVLDTWFSSALWPFSTLGWPEKTPDLERFYPTSVLVTGYDILFFWVARMMMFGLYAMDGAQPFNDVFLHGLVRDSTGKKMSKSKGNSIDPLEWLDRYGADALRFTLARGANPGADEAVAEEWAAGARNFGTKLWNASRFALMNGANTSTPLPDRAELTDADRWILDRLDTVVAGVDELFERFEFGKACDTLYHFVWDEFCDWYLELAKTQLNGDEARATATRAVLGHTLDATLRLLHPVMPFITEVVWRELTGGQALDRAAWPVPSGATPDVEAERRIDDLRKLVTEVRRFRSDQGLKPGQRVDARLTGTAVDRLADQLVAARALTRLDEPGDGFAPTVSLEVGLASGEMTVEIDTSGAVDVEAERKRLTKDLAAAEKELAGCEKKLGNPAFTEKAPPEVRAKIEARRETAEVDIRRLRERLAGLPG